MNVKNECDIVKDLLCQYVEGECSEATREYVSEHLKGCECCRAHLEALSSVDSLTAVTEQEKSDDAACKRGFKRLKQRWIASLLAVAAIIPLCLVGWMTANQSKGQGVCFTNIDEINTAMSFSSLLADGKYEKAAEMLELEGDYESIMESKRYHDKLGGEEKDAFYDFYKDVLEMTEDEYIEYRKNDFVDRLKTYSSLSYSLDVIGVGDVYRADGCWRVEVRFSEELVGKSKRFSIELKIKNGKVDVSGGSYGSYLTSEALGKVIYPDK